VRHRAYPREENTTGASLGYALDLRYMHQARIKRLSKKTSLLTALKITGVKFF